MDSKNDITEMHLDVLKEIGNIGAAHAATSLSQLLGQKIDMRVPKVELVTFDEMFDLAGGTEKVVAGIFLRIEGEVTGTMFFVLTIESATQFIRKLTGDVAFSINDVGDLGMGASALQELGNILSGSYLSALSDFTSLNIYPTVPSLSIDMVGAIVSFGLIEVSQYSDEVIVIETEILQEGEQGMSSLAGHFFLLPDPQSYRTIFSSLGVL
ncbi:MULTISPECIES: chemotaxis protein CheC [unclassified Sporosarcina]|uniref:chemotaxis protein CheC n=1 Tax=unclassified Sporosarcina TaxID=2647733 RepID=UPI000C167C9D|nr:MULTISPECIES: chemotaxis protein CheC [unclassified Sporosarcina]PID00182.1 CheY-P-specific phosphatase CheC [Sporosarcina sp. P29]PID06866.1 CheY-P-specific phosphatase CheC [Sporosarcina sp. P30]PID10060.1 CheY-P-specific phosphatase CheC [Sporosarcina sp. P31]PID13639.1 CheY-P-specific phosphatase CheC [Sporosarcina sp. P32b]